MRKFWFMTFAAQPFLLDNAVTQETIGERMSASEKVDFFLQIFNKVEIFIKRKQSKQSKCSFHFIIVQI